LGRIRSGLSPKTGTYQDDYNTAGQLKRLADDFGISVIVLHHLRKMRDEEDPLNEVSGTTGLTGAADTIITLRRARGKVDGILRVTGRDVDEQEIALNFHEGVWTSVGDARMATLTPHQQLVIKAIRTHGPIGPKRLSDLSDMNLNTAKTILTRLAEDGILKNLGGAYEMVEEWNP